MASAESEESTRELLQHHLGLATQLCSRCQQQSHIPGSQKLFKKCQAELKFLRGLEDSHVALKASHLHSSNLSHLQGIVATVEMFPGVTSVLQPFCSPTMQHSLVVDVVCNQGYTWVKVIARKAQALHVVWAGGGQFGERSTVDQACQYMECAKAHPHNFTTPTVLFHFCSGITEPLKVALQNLGVQVMGDVHPVDPETVKKVELVKSSIWSSSDEDDEDNNGGDARLQQVSGGGAEQSVEAGSRGCTGINSSQQDQSTVFHKASSSLQPQPQGDPNYSSRAMAPHIAETDREAHCDKLEPVPQNTEAGHLAQVVSAKCSQNTGVCDIFNSSDGLLSSDASQGVPSSSWQFSKSNAFSTYPSIGKVNLDITTLISLVSNVCHGNCHFIFEDDILNTQAEEERERPLVPELQSFMADKELYVCNTALSDFQSILKTVGGPRECERAAKLLQKVKVMPDDPSPRSMTLLCSAKVKDRAKVIFGTGDTMQAITMTANSGFVRAASNQGVTFAVFLHQSRALTEKKEATACPYIVEASKDTAMK